MAEGALYLAVPYVMYLKQRGLKENDPLPDDVQEFFRGIGAGDHLPFAQYSPTQVAAFDAYLRKRLKDWYF